ncbi:DUF411 domain-containing protein [Brevundimonas vesicularis]|uniref:DUF411 domain-containing protein n=1 Tax=Brevundimonas vesicularis TaxID=41276 RepID=UPI0008304240|nr:DUF411 domain-containing protein [Brevundimonas vesicularis]
MSHSTIFARRGFLGSVILVAALPTMACARLRDPSVMTVYKTPTCACCDAWVEHLHRAGIRTTINVLPDLRGLRSSHGMPEALASCHSGLIDGYFIEGHVPAEDVRRLLTERPDAVGITVPGMPLGSPGMETDAGDRDAYDTLLVLRSGETRVFASHNA